MIRFREATQGDLKGLLALYTQLNDNTMPEIDGRGNRHMGTHAPAGTAPYARRRRRAALSSPL